MPEAKQCYTLKRACMVSTKPTVTNATTQLLTQRSGRHQGIRSCMLCRCLSVCAGLYNTRRSSSSCTFQGGHRPQNYEHHVTQGDNRPHAQHDAVTTGIYIYKHC